MGGGGVGGEGGDGWRGEGAGGGGGKGISVLPKSWLPNTAQATFISFRQGTICLPFVIVLTTTSTTTTCTMNE